MHKQRHTFATAVTLVLASMAAAAPAAAQQGGATLEEIVVTAQKREQSLQDVGLTIAAFTEDSYRELSRGALDGLAGQVSNVQAYVSNSYLQNVHIRGVGLNEFQGQYDSPVAQHIDEVYMAKSWMRARRHYDIQRVEVLKGPQGTLFGRNTTGGALNFYTKAPVDAFEAELELGIDEHERYRATGALNSPIAGRLYGRFSFNAELGNGGPQKNLFTGKEHGEPELFDFRGQLLWEGEQLTVRLLAHGGIDEGEKVTWKGPGIYNAALAHGMCPQLFTGDLSKNPSACSKTGGVVPDRNAANQNAQYGPADEFEPEDTHTVNQNTPAAVDDAFWGGYLRLDYALGENTTLTSITAYEYYERIHIEDSQSDVLDSTSTHYYNEMNQISQELRLAGAMSDRWRYILGFFYEDDDLEQVDGSDLSEQPILMTLTPTTNQFFGWFDLDTQSIAAFMHNEFDFTDRLTLSLGVRYTRDRTRVSDVLLGLGAKPITGKEKFVAPTLVTNGDVIPRCRVLPPDTELPELPVAESTSCDKRVDEDFSWRAGIELKATDNLLVYSNVTTGYRSGGYALPFSGVATEFEPEKLLALELGLKYRLLDDAMQLNASIFQYHFDNVHVNVDDPISPLVPITRNIGEQLNRGVEAELAWQPLPGLSLAQGVSWMDAEFNDTDRTVNTYSGVVPLEGKRPVNSPEWTLNGRIRYQRPLFSGWDGIVSLDYSWVDDRFLEATNQPFDRADDYWLVNARLALASQDGAFEVALYGANLFDSEYLTYINNVSFFKLDVFGEQQTFGAQVRYRYR